MENYRPISILPSISKYFEKVIYNQLNDYFDVNKLFHSSQYGFRKQHSTELAAMELVDRVTLEMDRGEIPFGIFFNFRKLLTRWITLYFWINYIIIELKIVHCSL